MTDAELVERCRELDPSTVPSTIYRTLDVFEQLGVVRHAHGADGHGEFHVLPARDHGHLHCGTCGRSWELVADEAEPLARALAATRGFAIDLSHLSVGGTCAACRSGATSGSPRRGDDGVHA